MITVPDRLQIPQLDEHEKTILQNILLRISLEEERIERFKACINTAQITLGHLRGQLEIWKGAFNNRLGKVGFNISQVNIDADSGCVTLVDNVQPLKVENATS